MDIRKILDLEIKRAETGEVSGGYRIERNGETVEYQSYMTNEKWEEFLDNMEPEAKSEYENADGGELSEKSGRPPKMASYGSSSRMIYNLSRNIEDFHFEKQLHTAVGGRANIDGFAERPERYIFVEAKCREPYSKPLFDTVSGAYRELYEYINENMGGSLICEMSEHPSRVGYMNVQYLVDGEALRYFDMKQMICHFLGIAAALLNGELSNKQIDFLYLLYDPTELDCGDRIKDIYGQLCGEIVGADMSLLFVTVLRFLRDLGVGELDDCEIDAYLYKLTFTLCNQDFYPELV